MLRIIESSEESVKLIILFKKVNFKFTLKEGINKNYTFLSLLFFFSFTLFFIFVKADKSVQIRRFIALY